MSSVRPETPSGKPTGASPMRAQHAPDSDCAVHSARARASTHLGEASAPKARGWGHPSSRTVTKLYTYDALGRLSQTSNAGVTRSTTYTATGKRATATDEDGRVTRYAYDALDRLTTTTYPDGTTTSQSYDAEGRALSSTDEAGNTTAYVYDPLGRRVRTTLADGASTSTAYDSAGNAIQSADELGHVTWSAYDAAGRLTSTTDPTGAKTQSVYDAAGNTASRTDPLGHATSYAYDADNRVVATTYADGTAESTSYDAAGRMSARTDTLGRTTLYGYDHLGQLVKVTDALGNVTQYAYNEKGAREVQVDANNNATTFLYDFISGAETARFLPDGSAERHSVDNVGQVLRRTDFSGQRTFYTYDPRGRVPTRAYPDGSVVSFTYTPTGRRATATDARGTTSYAYDSRNRVVRITYPDGRVLSMGYDAHGNRTSLTAKLGATNLGTTTGYDVANRPDRITDPLARSFGITYDADGNRTQITYPNGTTTTYAYALNRLTNLDATETPASGPPTTVTSFAYTLDLAGRRTQLTEGDGTVRQYAYDGIDRLAGEMVTGALSYAKTFTYDPVGNRRTQTTTGSGAATVNYAYDVRDELTTENATTYSYDANGDVTSKSGEATYSWDFENRLTNVRLSTGTLVNHLYDADGNRVQTSVTPSAGTTSTTNMLVDTTRVLSQVVAETDGVANLTALYMRAGDELLEVIRPAAGGTWSTRFVHDDGLGSVRALTDEAGSTIDTRAYEAFGTKNVEAGNDPLTYGFAGEPFQLDSMLAYHRARWIDARLGRFEGMDQVDGYPHMPASLHRYVYASNAPTGIVDPSGNEGVDAEPSFVPYAQIQRALSRPPKGHLYRDIQEAIDDGLKIAWAMASPGGQLLDWYKHGRLIQNSPLLTEAGGYVYESYGPFGVNGYYFDDMKASIYADAVDLPYDPDRVSAIRAIIHTHPSNGLLQNAGFHPNEFSPEDVALLWSIGTKRGWLLPEPAGQRHKSIAKQWG